MIKFSDNFEVWQAGIPTSVVYSRTVAGVSLLTISAHNTDYLPIQTSQLKRAIKVFLEADHALHYTGD